MSSTVVIRVENVSKQYRLGLVGTGTFSHDLNRFWYKVRGKDDPYIKIGDENDRSHKGDSEYVWALKDINFDVKQGEVLGIIGRNGAGKSTLLKILSRTTLPTSGNIKIKGRVASLLEVGTGFHPELTGRENIYLNGAILGMRKAEINGKFDEIVDFSGVEKYIDTPVKRYSSGMYVRLAFAVAAHLEPEILIVDEVLAVGDAEFQKKCLGKMKDVSVVGGRTVLFVSHNMTAMNSLCGRAIYLSNGNVKRIGHTSDVISDYLSSASELTTWKVWDSDCPGDDIVKLLEVRLIGKDRNKIDSLNLDTEAGFEFRYRVLKGGFLPIPNIHLFSEKGDHVFVSGESYSPSLGVPGIYKSVMWLPKNLLNVGRYVVGVATTTMVPQRIHFFYREALIFDVIEDMNLRSNDFRGPIPGVIRPNLTWETKQLSC